LGGGEFGQGVAGFVEVGIGEAELVEALEEPLGASPLAEGRCGDAEDFEMPLTEAWLLQVQPVEGAMDCGRGGEARDTELGRGGHFSG
jgi:hypothetical protein